MMQSNFELLITRTAFTSGAYFGQVRTAAFLIFVHMLTYNFFKTYLFFLIFFHYGLIRYICASVGLVVISRFFFFFFVTMYPIFYLFETRGFKEQLAC